MPSNKYSLIKNFALIGGSTLVNMFIGLLTTPIITRIVDPDSYGQLSIFSLYISIAVMILCLGLDQSLVRFYFEGKTNKYRNALLSICIKIPLIITSTVCIVFFGIVYTGLINFEFNNTVTFYLWF